MASDNTEYLRHYGERLDKKVRQLLNSDLKAILKELGLQVSGNKSLLQERILQREHLPERVKSDLTRCISLILVSQTSANYNERVTCIISTEPTTLSADTAAADTSLSLMHTPADTRRTSLILHLHGLSTIFRTEVLPTNTTPIPTRLRNQLHRIVRSPNQAGSLKAYALQAQCPSRKALSMTMLSSCADRSRFMVGLALSHYQTVANVLVTNTGRATVHANVSLAAHQVERLRDSGRSWKVMAYCCYEQDPSPKDIAFPAQVELRCNTHNYSGNLRGIKKKAGTTKPADLTPFCTKSIGYNNQVSISYAGTDKRFLFSIYLVKVASVEELVEKVRTGQIISKQAVLNEMINKAKDPDIVATSTIMSLKCPLSAMKMQLPCRSTLCNHNQCFDATSFLQLQEQAPQWSCPVCAKNFPFEALVIDQYVQDIIQRTDSSAEQVTVQPDGRWDLGVHANNDFRMPSARPSEAPSSKRKAEVLDVDGGVEIVSQHANSIRNTSAAKPAPSPQAYPTPSFSASREPSAPPSASSRSGSKRPTDTIDLTLSSDDEDDEPPRRPVKRQSTSNGLLTTTSQLHSPSVSNYSHTPTSAPVDGGSRPPWMSAPYQVSAHSQSPGASTIPMPRPSASYSAQSPQYGSTFSGGYGAQNSTGFGFRR